MKFGGKVAQSGQLHYKWTFFIVSIFDYFLQKTPTKDAGSIKGGLSNVVLLLGQ